MQKVKLKTKHIIAFSAMALILVVIIVANAVCFSMAQWLTDFFGGRGTTEVTEVTLEGADALVQEIEGEGIIMLKNEGQTLPIRNKREINVFGWACTDAGFIRSGSGSGDASEHGTSKISYGFLDGLKKVGYKPNEELVRMYQRFCSKKEATKSLESVSDQFFKLYEPSIDAYTDAVMSQALNYSENAIIVISRSGGEGQDLPRYQTKIKGTTRAEAGSTAYDYSRHYLELSTEEEALINKVTNAGFRKVVIIINTVNVMELGFLNNAKIGAALSVGGPGQSGCISIARVLRGEINPSGKTADTYAYDLTTAPSFEHAGDWGVEQYIGLENRADEYWPNASGQMDASYVDYVENIYVGYKWYETADAEGFWNSQFARDTWGIQNGYSDVVQYPFGYGKSYSQFEITKIEWMQNAGESLKKDGKIELKVTVKNKASSPIPGKEVVQVYWSPTNYTSGGIEKASVNLCAYAKTDFIYPGKTEEVVLSFKVEDMKSYDAYDGDRDNHTGYELERGSYEISVRTDAHNKVACNNNSITYSVDSDIYYDEGVSDGVKVKNRFTGSDAYGGVSIDGKNSGANITYLTRADFAGTFPTQAKREALRRYKHDAINALGYSWHNQNNVSSAPITGSKSTNYKLTNSDGTWNEDLVGAIGSNYDDSRWVEIVRQLNKTELIGLVEDAGFKTMALDSVGKPECIDVDGPTGLNANNIGGTATIGGSGVWTAYPVEMVLSATWNDELAYRFGRSVGLEAAESNISGWYAPGANIHRSPFGGRNFEYYSEDAFLSGKMCAYEVYGCLTKGLYCYMKHFAVNENEEQRTGLYTWLTEQSLREIYLRPFEIAVKEGKANAMMTSFNRIGAIWAGGNKALMEDVARGEWGFRGTMLTDWSSGGDYMNLDQGLATGSDAWLNGAHWGVGGHNNKDTNAGISDMQRAAKNILYTYCNTYHVAKTEGDGMSLKQKAYVFPVWILILVAIDLIGVAGVGVWAFFTIKKIKKTAQEDVVDDQVPSENVECESKE